MRRSTFRVGACLAFCLTAVISNNASSGDRGETGACCFSDGSCLELSPAGCDKSGGDYQGADTVCAHGARGAKIVTCEPKGACCFGRGQCQPDTTQSYCEIELQGTWAGQGTFCGKEEGGGVNSFTGVNNPVGPGGPVFCFVPLNDDCVDAIAIDSLGDPVYGSNLGSTEDIIPDCESIGRGFDKFGVWYKVTGTGSVLSASVCGLELDARAAVPRSVLFVYCGGCENLQCVAGDGGILQSCMDRALNPVEWCSVVGEEYLILVALEGESTNDFMLLVEDTGSPCEGLPCVAENDECEGAITITTGFPVGNTYNATPSDAPSCTIDKPLGSGDVWYRINGVGGPMFAEICAQFPGKGGQYAELHLYCGQCDNLNCLDGEFGLVPLCPDLQRGSSVRVDWCSEFDETYFLRVVWPSYQGEFMLHVDTTEGKCEPEPCGTAALDFCEGAEPICPGILYTGDTFNATNDYLDHGAPISTVFFCGALMALYDNWYSYTPSESGLLFVHVEQLPTEWVFGVYDDCPENGGKLLKCNITRHHGVIVVPVNAYHTYYIRIAGFLESRGTYIMDILGPPCANLPPNGSNVGVQ